MPGIPFRVPTRDRRAAGRAAAASPEVPWRLLPVLSGLCEPPHRETLGPALVLFSFILGRADWNTGVWRVETAALARHLNMHITTLLRLRRRLAGQNPRKIVYVSCVPVGHDRLEFRVAPWYLARLHEARRRLRGEPAAPTGSSETPGLDAADRSSPPGATDPALTQALRPPGRGAVRGGPHVDWGGPLADRLAADAQRPAANSLPDGADTLLN
jgi:hypothetical protein